MVTPVFFPAAGYRNNSNGSLNNVGTNGYYWSAVPNSSNNGRNLNFNSGNVNPLNNNNRANGFSVRPVQAFTALRRRMSLLFQTVTSNNDMNISDEQLLYDLYRAYYDARRNKRNTKSQLRFEVNLEHNLTELYEELRTRTYRPSPCICFITFEPVKREVFASEFRDRVVHHLLFNYIAPYFDRLFIRDSYSCRKGKGTLDGIRRLEHHIRSCSENYTHRAYVLKLDIKGYFMSIDKARLYDIVMGTIRRKVATSGEWRKGIDMELTDYLVRAILFRDPTEDAVVVGDRRDWDGLPPSKSLFCSRKGTGMPIGDLTSQLFSNIYLNELDQFVKRELRQRHYGRYVDDFYVVHRSKRELKRLVPVIRRWLEEELGLVLHPDKTIIQPVEKSLLFLGACERPYRRYPRSRTVGKFRQRMYQIGQLVEHHPDLGRQGVKLLRSVINSYLGYLAHYRSYLLVKRHVDRRALYRYFLFTSHFRKAVVRKKKATEVQSRCAVVDMLSLTSHVTSWLGLCA